MYYLQFFQEKQQQMEELNAKEEELLKGNPLLNNTPTSFSVKRRLASCLYILVLWLYELLEVDTKNYSFLFYRWDDDVVFKNQARGEMKAPKRFINDTIRNDFHRKFLHRYMKWFEHECSLLLVCMRWMNKGFISSWIYHVSCTNTEADQQLFYGLYQKLVHLTLMLFLRFLYQTLIHHLHHWHLQNWK